MVDRGPSGSASATRFSDCGWQYDRESTIAKRREQDGGDQIGRRPRIAAIAVSPQPAVKAGKLDLRITCPRLGGLENGGGPSRNFIGGFQTALANNEAV